MDLTPEEIELIQKLGFDRDVMAKLKAVMRAPLREFKGAESVPKDKKFHRPGVLWSDDEKQEQIRLLEEMSERSPDARDLIAGWIQSWHAPPDEKELEQIAREARHKEFIEKSKPYEAYLTAEWQRVQKEMQGGKFSMPAFLNDLRTDVSVDQRIEEMRQYYDGQPVPKLKKQPAMPQGLVFRMEKMNWLKKMSQLNKLVAASGYKLQEIGQFIPRFQSPSREEVRHYVKSLGLDPPLEDVCSLGPFRHPLQDINQPRRNWTGDETIQKVEGGFEIIRPQHYSVNFYIVVVLLVVKLKKIAKRDKFEIVKDAGTAAPNYGIGPDEILDKLMQWDKLYDIEIESARHDSVTVVFKNLPDDLRALCTEIQLFCADLDIMHGDCYEDYATCVREFAVNLRQSKTVGFWWD